MNKFDNLLNNSQIQELFDKQTVDRYQGVRTLRDVGMERPCDRSGLIDIPIINPLTTFNNNFSSAPLSSTPLTIDSVIVKQEEYATQTNVNKNYEDLFSFDFTESLVSTSSMAIGRRDDMVKLQAIESGDYSTDNNNLIDLTGSANENISIANLTDAKQLLKSNAVFNMNNCAIIGNAGTLASLYHDPSFTNWFYTDERPLQYNDGIKRSTLLGCHFCELSGETENSIPVESNGNTAIYVVSVNSLATAYNKRPFTIVDFVRYQQMNYVTSKIVMGSQIIQDKGIIKIKCKNYL